MAHIRTPSGGFGFAPPTQAPSQLDQLTQLGHALSAVEAPDQAAAQQDNERRHMLLQTALGLMGMQQSGQNQQAELGLKGQELEALKQYHAGTLAQGEAGHQQQAQESAARLAMEDKAHQGTLDYQNKALDLGKGQGTSAVADTMMRSGNMEDALQLLAAQNPNVYGPLLQSHKDSQLKSTTAALAPMAQAMQKKFDPNVLATIKQTAGALPRGDEAYKMLADQYGWEKPGAGPAPAGMEAFANDPELGPMIQQKNQQTQQIQQGRAAQDMATKRAAALQQLDRQLNPDKYLNAGDMFSGGFM